ncbi:MAG: HD domain-containing protein [Candidatus Saccharibacteria bacterium]
MNFSLADITALHKKYAPSDAVFDLVFTHSQIVNDIALQLLEKNNLALDRDLVRSGALLHDIGVYPLFGANGTLRADAAYITHGTEGEKILKKENLPQAIWRFAAHHTGVGLTKQDVINQKLPLPIADYLAETDEELLIMYADKFHSKTTPPYLNSYQWYRQDIAKFGSAKVATFDQLAQQFGLPNLPALSEKYSTAIR